LTLVCLKDLAYEEVHSPITDPCWPSMQLTT